MDESDSSSSDLFSYDTVVTIHEDGENIWKKAVILKSVCKVDVEFFPYDDQKCVIKFASWAYDIKIMNMKPFKEHKQQEVCYS